MKAFISVLVPIYGVENYIEKCVRSLFENTYAEKTEFVFVNDYTKDNSMAILNSVMEEFPNLKDNIKIINHETNKGLAGARNTALQNATGEYVLCMDSDDWVENDYIEQFWNEAEKSSPDVITCNFIEECEGKSLYTKQGFKDNYEDVYKDLLKNEIRGYVWCKLIKRSIFTDNKIAWIEGLNMWEDVWIDSQVFLFARKFSSIDSYLYHYRSTNTTSIVHSKNIKKYSDMFTVLKNIKAVLIQKNLFSEFQNEFKFKVLECKRDFLMDFNCKPRFLKRMFTESDIDYYKKNMNQYSSLRKVCVYLIAHKKFVLLSFLSFIKAKIGKRFCGFNNFKDEEVQFIWYCDD